MLQWVLTQSAGAIEYINCISTERFKKKVCPEYVTKQSDGKIPVILVLGNAEYTFIAIVLRSTLALER